MAKAFGRPTLAVLLALMAAVALIHPVAEMGMNDDWSYIRTAYDMARTGRLLYNGWAAPIIGFQAYWGGLFIRLFGFSFTVARASTVILTLLFIPLLLRLFRTAGLHAPSALFATLALVLSPLLLVSITSFMTDMPAFLLFAGALWSGLEAWKAVDRGKAIVWMLLVFLFGAMSGSVRQVYWAASLWFLLVLAVARFKKTPERLASGACIAATLAFALFVSRWQNAQPYVAFGSMTEAVTALPWNENISVGGTYLLRLLIDCAVLLMPVSAAFFPLRPRLSMLPLLLVSGWLVFHLAQPLPWLGNTLTENGGLVSGLVVAGEKPLVLSPFAIWLIATTGLFGLGAAAARRVKLPSETVRFAVLTVPFLCVYIGAIAVRGPVYGIYDRYSIPIIAILAVLLLASYQQKTANAIPAAAWIVLCVFAVYGVAVTHDSYAEARARLEAANKLLLSGVTRTQVLAGFEFDCWTQVEKIGHINNQLVKVPASAYQNADDCSGADNLQFWWRSHVPVIQADYVVTLSPLPELEPGIVFQAPYKTWLPYGTHYAYVQRSATRLSCQGE